MAATLERYLSDESCGKTIPCRIGVRRLYEMGQRATSGHVEAHGSQKSSSSSPPMFATPRCAASNTARPIRS